MFHEFIRELRQRKVPVGIHEAVALAGALAKGLHDSSLDGFYHVARALLIHSEAHLDAFDQAFAFHFRGVESAALELTKELLDWLKDARGPLAQLTDEERALLEQLDPAELERMFEERLKEQKERHDGGNRWVGTRGSSAFGHSGAKRPGIRVGGPGGNRSAIRVASERRFREYRDDETLDVRQLSVALRKLRAFIREGQPDELDLDETIRETAKNAGELEVVTRPPRRPNTRVILMMDVGGSMDPYSQMVSRLFTAAKKATHFKELRSYYFHNCIYGRVYEQATFRAGMSFAQLFAECDKRYKLIVVGDALMAPYELLARSGVTAEDPEGLAGLAWLMRLAEHFPQRAWLNPEPPSGWSSNTIELVSRVFPMFQLSLSGLEEAAQWLARGVKSM